MHLVEQRNTQVGKGQTGDRQLLSKMGGWAKKSASREFLCSFQCRQQMVDASKDRRSQVRTQATMMLLCTGDGSTMLAGRDKTCRRWRAWDWPKSEGVRATFAVA